LQKTKTRIITSEEFLATSELAEENKPENHEEARNRQFLSLRLHYDPYSVTANEDYDVTSEFQLPPKFRTKDCKGLLHCDIVNEINYTVEATRNESTPGRSADRRAAG
jgi:hypothetical protein